VAVIHIEISKLICTVSVLGLLHANLTIFSGCSVVCELFSFLWTTYQDFKLQDITFHFLPERSKLLLKASELKLSRLPNNVIRAIQRLMWPEISKMIYAVELEIFTSSISPWTTSGPQTTIWEPLCVFVYMCEDLCEFYSVCWNLLLGCHLVEAIKSVHLCAK